MHVYFSTSTIKACCYPVLVFGRFFLCPTILFCNPLDLLFLQFAKAGRECGKTVDEALSEQGCQIQQLPAELLGEEIPLAEAWVLLPPLPSEERGRHTCTQDIGEVSDAKAECSEAGRFWEKSFTTINSCSWATPGRKCLYFEKGLHPSDGLPSELQVLHLLPLRGRFVMRVNQAWISEKLGLRVHCKRPTTAGEEYWAYAQNHG